MPSSDPTTPPPTSITPTAVLSNLFLPAGVFASVDIVPDVMAPAARDLHVEEHALVASMPALRQATFVAGRQALRAAVRAVAPGQADAPLLRTRRGAPQMPEGIAGSISHKRTRAIAIAAPRSGGLLGIDLELRPVEADASRPSIADRILTSAERAALEGLDALAHREATLVRFALKEAVYKAIDPYVERYVRFTEVELDVRHDGTAIVRLLLPELSEDEVVVESRWRVDDRWIIAVARSVRR